MSVIPVDLVKMVMAVIPMALLSPLVLLRLGLIYGQTYLGRLMTISSSFLCPTPAELELEAGLPASFSACREQLHEDLRVKIVGWPESLSCVLLRKTDNVVFFYW